MWHTWYSCTVLFLKCVWVSQPTAYSGGHACTSSCNSALVHVAPLCAPCMHSVPLIFGMWQFVWDVHSQSCTALAGPMPANPMHPNAVSSPQPSPWHITLRLFFNTRVTPITAASCCYLLLLQEDTRHATPLRSEFHCTRQAPPVSHVTHHCDTQGQWQAGGCCWCEWRPPHCFCNSTNTGTVSASSGTACSVGVPRLQHSVRSNSISDQVKSQPRCTEAVVC
jgi:hypothetical protein